MLRSSWSTRYCLFLIFLWSIPLQYATHWGTNTRLDVFFGAVRTNVEAG
jgi:hypothetical protein